MTALKKWDPFREMEDSMGWGPLRAWEPFRKTPSLRDHMFGWIDRPTREMMATVDWSPAIDVAEDDKEFLITAELPDVKKGDLKVTVKDSVLSITGERKKEQETKEKKYHRIERAYGSFERSFTLPEDTDAGKIVSSFKDGLLTVHVPKAPEVRSRIRDVKIG